MEKEGELMDATEIMNNLIFFVILSAVVTMSGQVLNNIVKDLNLKEKKFNRLILSILGITVAFASQVGLLCAIFWCDGKKLNFLPDEATAFFKNVDLFMTGLLYSLSSDKIISIYKQTHGLRLPENKEEKKDFKRIKKSALKS